MSVLLNRSDLLHRGLYNNNGGTYTQAGAYDNVPYVPPFATPPVGFEIYGIDEAYDTSKSLPYDLTAQGLHSEDRMADARSDGLKAANYRFTDLGLKAPELGA